MFQLIILSKWAPLNEDLSEKERILASELLRFLTERLSVERTEVFKYNLDNIKLIVEAWKSVLKVPTQMITNYIASKEKCVIGIHLTSIFLVNKLEVWNNNEKEHFLDLLLSKLSYKSKAVIKPCAETIGLLIKYLDDEIYTSKVDGYLKKVDYGDYLVCLQGEHDIKFFESDLSAEMGCIEYIQLTYSHAPGQKLELFFINN